MRRVVLAVPLFSIFSSVLSPITASALPVGSDWGIERETIVEEIIEESNGKVKPGSMQETILNQLVVPLRINLFKNSTTYFQIDKQYRPMLLAMGLRNICTDINSKEYRNSPIKWMQCTIKSY